MFAWRVIGKTRNRSVYKGSVLWQGIYEETFVFTTKNLAVGELDSMAQAAVHFNGTTRRFDIKSIEFLGEVENSKPRKRK